MTTTFTEFLRALDASLGVQGRNILLFTDNCANPQGKSCLQNITFVYYMPICTA